MRLLFFLSGLLLSFSSFEVAAATNHQDKVVTAIGESWVGRDASLLLTQWPIDSGFTTSEIARTQETSYSFKFGQQAHVESYSVSDGWSPAGTGAQGELVMQENSHIEKRYVPERIDCLATFYANAEGIISHFEYIGDSCRSVFRYWGRPKQ
jgi:hypothetical protein